MKKKNRIFNSLYGFFNVEGLSCFFSRKIFNNFILIFLILIFLPLIFGLTGINDEGSEFIDENRMKMEKPEFKINSIFPYFRRYEAYYNDNFSFRSFLINRYNLLKYNLSGTSPLDSVYIGKGGWLFLAEESRIRLDKYYFSYRLFTDKELELWRIRLTERAEWAAALGCKYIFMIVPNKQTIYPEMMPEGMNNIPDLSMTDQLTEYIRTDNNLLIIDLRNEFRKLKMKYRLYQMTDTHWNHKGAYSAYSILIRMIADLSGDKIETDFLSGFNEILHEKDGGDLAKMLSFDKNKFRDRVTILERNRGPEIENFEIRINEISEKVIEKKNPEGGLPPLLFIHDSFGDYLLEYLPLSFGESYYSSVRDLKLFNDFIRERGIKFIVEEIAERHFLQKPPEPVIIIK